MGLKRFFQSIQRDFDDIERLVKAFPSELENDVRAVAANLPFEDRNFRLANGTVQKHDFLVTEYKPDDLVVGNETVQLPYRVYLRESTEDQVKALTPLQRTILDCIYLRHNDGYIRQKHLERLSGQTESFICPFTVRLLGEYVVEILFVLEWMMNDKPASVYAEFLSPNPFFWKQTQSRVVSYWNEYYRSDFPKLNDYVGKRIVDRLNAALRNQSLK